MLDERRRHRMIDAFKHTHGEDTAMALAESLFSTDHATKADLKALETDLEALETRLNARIDNCATRADLDAGFSRQLRWVVGTMIAFMGLLTTGGGIVTATLLTAINA